MDNRLYNIDTTSFKYKSQTRAELRITGWFAESDADDYQLYFEVDGKRTEPDLLDRLKREDVLKARPEAARKYNVGFETSLYVDYPIKADEIKLIVEAGSEKKELWSEGVSKLSKMISVKTIETHLDLVDINKKSIRLSGWGISKTEEQPQYVVRDDLGNNIDFVFKAVGRPDASRSILGDDRCRYCGYDIKFDYDIERKYTLEIKDCFDTQECVIKPKKELKKASKRKGRKYKPFKEIVKSLNGQAVKDDFKCLFTKGPAAFIRQWKERCITDAGTYEAYIKKHLASQETLKKQSETTFKYMPKISIIVPAFKTPEKFLKQMVDSVREQSYSNWELCIADGGVDDTVVVQVMEEYAKTDARIKYKKLDANLGIAGNTNAALELATGDFIALLDHDDILAKSALFEVVEAINSDSDVDVVYTDEDKISMDLKTHFEPHFKPDFNLDLLRSNNYICHLFVVRRQTVEKGGIFRGEFDGSQDYDFIFRCVENARKIKHLPRILYHWRMHQNSTAENPESKMYCYDAGKRAIEAHLERLGIKGTVEMTEHLGYYRVKYEVKDEPLVSIVIPNKDNVDCLTTCINSIKEKSTYKNYEIIIIENNSTSQDIFDYYNIIQKAEKNVKVAYWMGEFNYSAINNYGLEYAEGEYIILLNNDTEIITPDWIELMLGQCQRKDVGIVGAKLYYPDDTIQHAGVIVGLGGVAGHVYTGTSRDDVGYFARAILQQDLSAVTAACLMVKRSVYDEVKGLNETLKVAFNDVDFCLRVRQKGYLIVFEPQVELYHYESKSRGQEDNPEKIARFEGEVKYMQEHWSNILENGDPYYNINLTLSKGDCSLRN